MKKLNSKLFAVLTGLIFSILPHTAMADISPGYLELNGTDRYMLIPNSDEFDIPAGGTMTVSLRAKLDRNTTEALISNRVRNYGNSNNGDVSGWAIYNVSGTTSVSFNYPGSSWTARHHNTTHISTGTYHHLCWVYSGSSSTFYIDGVATSNPPATVSSSAIPSYADILVGANYVMNDNEKFSIDNLTAFTQGEIDDVRIYREALSAEEVATDQTASAPIDGKTVIAAYDFTDIQGATVPDISGNGHNGTLVGTWPNYGDLSESYTVTVSAGTGGTVSITDNDGNPVNSGDKVATGTNITITAIPDNSYTVSSVSVNGTQLSVTDGVATLTVNGDCNITVTFAYSDASLSKIPVFTQGENGSQYYRIPAIAKAADGSLIAVADQRGSKLNDLPNTISVVAKRSTDGGQTWSDMVTIAQGNSSTGKTYGDPAIVLDRNTGRLIVIYSGDQGFWTSTKSNRAGFYISTSDDNGITWSGPTAITDQVYLSSWYGAFCASGSATQLKSGRICFVANAHMSSVSEQDVNEYMVYSDDGGNTWQTSASNAAAGVKGNESKIVELADGTLLMSIRNYEGGYHRFSKSTDQGMTWGTPYEHQDILEPSCNGDIIRYPSKDGRNRLLLSIPNSTIRENLSVFLSYDEGESWSVKKTLIEGYSAYSSLEVLDDGTICCLVEDGKWDDKLPGEDGFDIYLMKFPLEWLTDGRDHFDPDAEADNDAPIFITIGQSNADGSAFFDETLDNTLKTWYESDANAGKMKMWYRSTQVQNQSSNALGEAARWVVDGSTTDVAPGWLNLWYRNENREGRTAMNMIHSYGTYSTGTGTDCAQGRRGMEGQFGKVFATEYPDKELYMIKLGVSGSFISSWANPADNTNWEYFYTNMFKPAVEDLLANGKRPRLAGIWWMQGCADSSQSQEYYQEWLEKLIQKCREELGFENGKFYIGHVVKPGESSAYPTASVQFGQGVRDAQDAVAEATEGVEIIDTKDCAFQNESNLGGYLHFSHEGVNKIGDMLAGKVIENGPSNWTLFSTPGTWNRTASGIEFVPSIGAPEITYTTEGSVVTATLTYPGWSEAKTYDLGTAAGEQSPGYLDLDGNNRYMLIENCEEFNIPAGGSMTVSLRAKLDNQTTQTLISNRVRNYENNNNNDVSGWAIYTVPQNTTVSFNYPGSGWNAKHNNSGSHISTGEYHHLCWVYSGSSTAFYIDGVATSNPPTTSATSAIPSYADILVGANYTMTDYTKFSLNDLTAFTAGEIDDVRIYGEALTAEEVVADQTASAPIDGKTVIAAYDFTDIQGTTVPDISGNNRNGILMGTWPDYTVASYQITIAETENGTVAVATQSGEEVTDGGFVSKGTVLTITPTPDEYYIVSSVSVNDAAIEAVDDVYSFTVTEDSRIAVVFERDPNAPAEYCTPSGNMSNGGRYTNTLNISDGITAMDVTPCQESTTHSVYVDKTDVTFSTIAGKEITIKLTSGQGEWMHHYVFVDYNNDGTFTPDLDATTLIPSATSELVAFDRYSGSSSESVFYDSKGQAYRSSNPGNPNPGGAGGITSSNAVTLPSFTIPEDTPTGDYRIRFMREWNSIDPCGRTIDNGYTSNLITNNGGAVIDFILHVEAPATRNVTVLSNDETLGKAAITSPADVEGNTVYTKGSVTVEATATAPAVFVNWTNQDNNVISTDETYVYEGNEDITLTANFGYNVTYSVSGNGTAEVTVGDTNIASGTPVVKDAEVTVNINPEAGYALTVFTVNGEDVKNEITDNVYTFYVSENVDIQIEFGIPPCVINVTAEGNCSYIIAEYIDGNTIVGEITSGEEIDFGSTPSVYITVPDNESLESVTVNNVEYTFDPDGNLNENYYYYEEPYYVVPLFVDGEMNIVIKATNKSGIDGIEADGDPNAPVEYFNLQGVKVNAENLVPGFYVRRQGSKATKVFVNK